MIKKIAITFGPDHRDVHAHIAPRIDEGYVVIEAPTHQIARDIAFAVFGEKWAFDYDLAFGHWEAENRRKGHHPAGELLRVAWLGANARNAIIATVDDTYEAADGDSNDAEIEALQDARDMLAELIDYRPEEAS